MNMNKMICPLCKTPLKHFLGNVDGSGNYIRPSVSCTCGFKFQRNNSYGVRVGESGWEAIDRMFLEDNKSFKQFVVSASDS